MSVENEIVIQTHDLKKHYVMGTETVRALRGVDVSIERNEYIAISRVLIETGLPSEMTVQATDLRKVFADYDSCFEGEPFALAVLAEQSLVQA